MISTNELSLKVLRTLAVRRDDNYLDFLDRLVKYFNFQPMNPSDFFSEKNFYEVNHIWNNASTSEIEPTNVFAFTVLFCDKEFGFKEKILIETDPDGKPVIIPGKENSYDVMTFVEEVIAQLLRVGFDIQYAPSIIIGAVAYYVGEQAFNPTSNWIIPAAKPNIHLFEDEDEGECGKDLYTSISSHYKIIQGFYPVIVRKKVEEISRKKKRRRR